METANHDTVSSSRRPLRVAVEGCGHGTLDAIYASISKGCEVNGWDNVDLVIICGDFQAVRDRRDLNVTAMPAKYRELADFHQYYWGHKKAPYLTLFIGGNHEASNYLWELYYGGWAAPNIYYLGAANVIQFGPLKVAAMSGIWKGYDYKKPHYERLPYSHDDMYSIYHVRELDTRKLLAYRSQVDIGLSHDWPRGIEWLGDHKQLFYYKKHLKEDADNGKLGNVAANQVLDHLRPRYWFSAHLHTRYAAIKHHQAPNSTTSDDSLSADNSKLSDVTAYNQNDHNVNGHRLAAWHNFHAIAKDDEARENAQIAQDQQARREEAERSGIPITAEHTYNETYKRVKLSEGFSRTVTSIATTDDIPISGQQNQSESDIIPQLDGCCSSLPVKRHRSPSHENTASCTDVQSTYVPVNNNGIGMSTNTATTVSNPDAIDLDSSDDEQPSDRGTAVVSATESEEIPLLPNKDGNEDSTSFQSNHITKTTNDRKEVPPPDKPTALPVAEEQSRNQNIQRPMDKVTEVDDQAAVSQSGHNITPSHEVTATRESVRSTNNDSQENDIEVSEEMRAQLAALSTTFADTPKHETSAPLPHPEAIRNKETRFLALSKCAPDQRFLQLLEVHVADSTTQQDQPAPKLRYDPEWLAILRTFSQELNLGGSPRDAVPSHRGDTYYREKIIEEEKWVDDHIVKAGLLDVPENFTITLPDGTSHDQVTDSEMPDESTNPQTTAFCQLIGIENKFNFSESDRQARRAQGPRPSSDSSAGRGGFSSNRGGRGGRGGGFHRGRGGRGRGRRH